MRQKTRREIMEETFAYYLEDPSRRAYDRNAHECRYRMSDGRRCAVGRCMTHENAKKAVEMGFDTELHEHLLKPAYQGHPEVFWHALQEWHDHPFEEGVDCAKARARDLMDEWAEDDS